MISKLNFVDAVHNLQLLGGRISRPGYKAYVFLSEGGWLAYRCFSESPEGEGREGRRYTPTIPDILAEDWQLTDF